MSPDVIPPEIGLPIAALLTIAWIVIELRATRRTR